MAPLNFQEDGAKPALCCTLDLAVQRLAALILNLATSSPRGQCISRWEKRRLIPFYTIPHEVNLHTRI